MVLDLAQRDVALEGRAPAETAVQPEVVDPAGLFRTRTLPVTSMAL
jgi:hypothetical protein